MLPQSIACCASSSCLAPLGKLRHVRGSEWGQSVSLTHQGLELLLSSDTENTPDLSSVQCLRHSPRHQTFPTGPLLELLLDQQWCA